MICLLAHVVASMLAGTEGETMSVLEERFRDHFAPWSISIRLGTSGREGEGRSSRPGGRSGISWERTRG